MKSPPPVVFYLPVRAEVAPRVHAQLAEPPGELPAHLRLQRGVVLVGHSNDGHAGEGLTRGGVAGRLRCKGVGGQHTGLSQFETKWL